MAADSAPPPPPPPQTAELYFSDKWKLSKKETSSRSCRSSSSFIKNSGHRRCAFTRKCARLVKEQRARFYIMRRYGNRKRGFFNLEYTEFDGEDDDVEDAVIYIHSECRFWTLIAKKRKNS